MEEWLSSLGVTVKDWDSDFSSGYLLGSLLYRYGRLDTFTRFVNKPDWRDRNLSLLGNGLDEIGINFYPEKLSSNEPGYAKSLLRAVFTKLTTILLSKEQRRSKSGSAKTKTERIEAKLAKFREEMTNQEKFALSQHQKRTEEIRQQQQEERKAHLDALRSNHLFMQQWANEGRQHWKANMQKLHAMKQHEITVKTDVATKFKNSQLQYISDNAIDEETGIEEFEKNLIRLGIDYNPDQSSTGPKKKVNLAAEAAVTMARIREKSKQHGQALKEKETRLNKMQFDQERTAKQNAVKQTLSELFRVVGNLSTQQTKFAVKRLKKHGETAKKRTEDAPKMEIAGKKRAEIVEKFEIDQRNYFQQQARELQSTLGTFKYQKKQSKITEMRLRHEKSAQAVTPLVESLLEVTDLASSLLQDRQQLTPAQWNSLVRYFTDGPSDVNEEDMEEMDDETVEAGNPDDMIKFRPASP